MNFQQIIDQALKLPDNQKQELAYYLLFSSLSKKQQQKFFTVLKEEEQTQQNEHSQEQGTSNRKFGVLKGGIQYMAKDFDEPLEDFTDYM